MFMHSFLIFYRQKKENYKQLLAQSRGLKPHRVVARKRGAQVYYYEVSVSGGKRLERAISKEMYNAYSLENYRYNSVRDEIRECEKFLKHYEKKIPAYEENVKSNYAFLSKRENLLREERKPFYTESTVYVTLRGEIVRSKSEEMIANLLYQFHIDYVYESSVAVGSMRPDFYIEDNIRGVPVIWEHFGLMNKLIYQLDCMRKIDEYAKYGYFVGYNLIITYELYDPDRKIVLFPFDSKRAVKVIREWFLP